MPKFTKDNQPAKGRGKSERTKILEALRRAGITEDGFYDLLIGRAIDPDDSFALKEVLARFSPVKKSVLPSIELDMPEGLDRLGKADFVLLKTLEGKIPPDVQKLIMDGLADAARIEDVKINGKRLDAIEKALGLGQ